MGMLLFGCSKTDHELHLHYFKFSRETNKLLETDPRVNQFLTVFKNIWTTANTTPH